MAKRSKILIRKLIWGLTQIPNANTRKSILVLAFSVFIVFLMSLTPMIRGAHPGSIKCFGTDPSEDTLASDSPEILARQELNLQIELQDSGDIRLSWSSIPDVMGYTLYHSQDPQLPLDSWVQIAAVLPTETQYLIQNPDAMGFYYISYEQHPVHNELIYVPGGSFSMGRISGAGDADELPEHSVSLDPFYIGKYEVTQHEWQTVMGVNPAHSYGTGNNHPVYNVSWYEVLKYCNLCSMAEGLTPVYSISGSTNPDDWGEVPDSSNMVWSAAICDWSASGYRILTEAEWEYAARGAGNIPDYLYSGSDDVEAVAWYDGNTPEGCKTVGNKDANGLDVFDMSGNVWEWCWDWYGSTYYQGSPDSNPTGPDNGTNRIVRGGSWLNSANSSRVVNRSRYAIHSAANHIGLRLGRSGLVSPHIDPPSGEYFSAQLVSITTTSPGASIRYTTDGSEPSESSMLYCEPFMLHMDATLKAKTFKTGFQPSETSVAEYVIGDFVFVPAGTFTMGRTIGLGDNDELPTHSVSLSSFYIGQYEVSQGEWQMVMDSNPAHNHGVGDNYPVYNVSWYEVLKYCNLRSMAEGLSPAYTISGSTDPQDWGDVPDSSDPAWGAAICDWNSDGYRLPTEAEWEYAARGAANTPDYLYSGSDDVDSVAWYEGNNTPNGTKPIGSKAPNEPGIFDMSGNVWEWCWDWYGSTYFESSPNENPTGPDSGPGRTRRGGYWDNPANRCRIANRGYYGSSYANFSLGFRLCRSGLFAPQFDPPAGEYLSAQEISINTATPGARIHYTTDGSEPSESSTLYCAPFILDMNTTLKAKAFKEALQPSETTVAEYEIGELVFVPAGSFTMGRTTGEGDSDELPAHNVTLNSFYMGKYEVTQDEWQTVMDSNPSYPDYGIGDNYPVNQVSWYAALKYCNLRSMSEDITPIYSINGSTYPADWGAVPPPNSGPWDAVICNWNANGYRLPTEAEWEYAARGATNTPDFLYGGSDNIDAVAWYSGNSGSTSHPVGTKTPNSLGLYDMSGNAYEWCWDWFSYSFYSSSPQNNPTGPESGYSRVLRGGDLNAAATTCRVANRVNDSPSNVSSFNNGFRVCRSFP